MAAQDPVTAQGDERTVRAEVIRALLLGGSSESGEVPALSIAGARMTGVLDLRHAEIRHPIRLTSCWFEHRVELGGTRTRRIDLSGSHLPAMAATDLRVDGELRLTNCRIAGNGRSFAGTATTPAVDVAGDFVDVQ